MGCEGKAQVGVQWKLGINQGSAGVRPEVAPRKSPTSLLPAKG